MRRLLVLFAMLLVFTGTVRAEDLVVPGLERDSSAYLSSLTARSPAGLSPQQRIQAEGRAADAIRRNDWPAAVSALEARVGGGGGTADQLMALARAQLRRVPPDPARAAQAAWLAFRKLDQGEDVPALLILADAFRAMKRWDYVVLTLENVVDQVPDDAGYKQQLAAARQEAGILVRGVTTEPEANPPQACIQFTTAPTRRGDFVPGDWVRLQPPQPAAAITREGDRICIAGLPLGATTQVTLRAGMPGEGGLILKQDAVLPVAMANREPKIVFEDRTFLLPRGQSAKVTMSTVNLSGVKLQVLRLSERNVVAWWRDRSLSDGLTSDAFGASTDNGKIVWTGTAAVEHWQPNQVAKTALPLPDVFNEAGLYVLMAQPADGTDPDSTQAVQVIMRTDLAPTVWRGNDGITVQVRSFADGGVRPGVALRLLSRANDILAETTTDADGVARFAAPLTRGTGPQAAQSVHAFLGTDFVSLDLGMAAFDLSDRGVEGAAQPGPLDAFAWTDRGIYRPGETVQLMALLRNAAGEPRDVPAHVVVKRPNGQVYLDQVPPREGDAAIHLPIPISSSAPAGTWSVELLADPAMPAIGRTSFRVDAFVPDRMAVELAPQGAIVPGTPFALPVTARFLYGAPAADLSGSATVQLQTDPKPPAALAGYTIGLAGEQFAPAQLSIDLPNTDAQGHATLPILLKAAPDTTRPVVAQVDVGVDDPSGRSSHASTTIPVRQATNYIGIRPGFADGAVDAGAEASFDAAAVNADGARIAVPARLKLVRERADWRMVRRGGTARYETTFRDEPIEQADVVLPASGAFHYAKQLPFGRYRIELVERAGLAATSIRFRSGWVASENPDTPDKVDVSTDRKLFKPGDTATVHIVSPFAGQATLLLLTDRVQSLRDIDVTAGGTDVQVPVDAGWGPGAYASVHVFRGSDGETQRPARAIGLAWIGIDPATRTIPVAIAAPDRITPRQRITVPVRTTPGAFVTLAAVDEGVLRLTGFKVPDPVGYFTGRRTLGIDIRDDWGRLIRPAEGESTVLKQGGDDGGNGRPEIPQKVVSLFVGPVQAGADGVASVPLEIPDFNGQIRLMAVAWTGTGTGAAGVDMIVRDPLIAEPLLPRFLAPGDEARFAVLLQNLDLPAGEASATVTLEGPLAIDGAPRLAAVLQPGAQAVRTATLRATGVGRGVIHLAIAGPGGFTLQRDTAITVRPARPAVSFVASGELAPKAEVHLVPAFARLIAGTGTAQAGFGGPVRYDPAAVLRSLKDYPLSCLEQSSSKGLPLAMLPDGVLAGDDRGARLQAAVASVLDKQRYDGAFGLWSASGEAEPWLSAYATEFLLRAQKAGAAVPEAALRDAIKAVADAVGQNADDPAALAARAYDLYVLALAGQPRAGSNRMLAEAITTLPTPLARAQLGAALALGNDRPRAEAAFTSALGFKARKDWYADRGSALRDQMAIAVLLKESGLLPQRLAELIAVLPGGDLDPNLLSTQEDAWAGAAAAALGRDGRPTHIAVNGQARPEAPSVTLAVAGPIDVRNLGERAVWQTLSTTGVPSDPPPAARAGMRVTRKFFTLTGDTLDLDHLKQNTVFVLLMEGRADDGQNHAASLIQGLPAGWEIAGRLDGGKVSGMPWLGELTATDAQPAADDRFAAVMTLTGDAPAFRVAVRLRAVTPGMFEMPGAQLSDMYRPAIFARQGVARIKVLAPE